MFSYRMELGIYEIFFEKQQVFNPLVVLYTYTEYSQRIFVVIKNVNIG